MPNQPFIFEDILPDQPCLNNDIRAYSQIVEPNDNICVQQKMLPCNPDIICEPTFVDEGAVGPITGGWTVSGGWTMPTGYNLSYDGTGGVVGQAYQGWPPGTLKAGNAYVIQFTITSVTGNAAVTLALGLDATTTTYNATGTYIATFICQDDADLVEFIMNSAATTAGDTMYIFDISISRYTTCWKDGLNFGYPSWTYVYETDGLTYYTAYFCSKDYTGGTLTNSGAYTVDGNYHAVNITITNCTQGGLEVVLGGVYIGTIYGNGEFTLYGTPTDTSGDLIFTKVDLFDGCITACQVQDYGLLDTADPTTAVYKLFVAKEDAAVTTDEIGFVINDDRITWCFNVSELLNGGLPIELSCDSLYQLLIVTECDEGEPAEFRSITTFRYNQDGWPCSSIVEAYADGYQLGFYFGSTTAPVFKLIQRLRILQFAPKYPTSGEEYLYSSGSWSRSYAQRGKVRTAWFDYVDEATHDVISTQVLCDVFTIDALAYYVPVKDYEPEWEEHKYNLAQSRIDIVKSTEVTIFKRSC